MVLNINLPQRAALGICAGLTALVSFTLVFALWQWHSDWNLAHQEVAKASALIGTNKTVDLIAAIPSDHLFGKSIEDGGKVPITNLQLSITGIVKVSSDQQGDTSKAYISIAGQPSKIYQIGDRLPYGVKIADITDTAVMLENDGHLEKLLLARQPLQFKPQSTEGIG